MNETTVIQELTITEKIVKGLDGRTQVTLVDRVKEYAASMPDCLEKDMLLRFTDVKLSRKMNGRDSWENYELKAISKILKFKL